jgi:hypothetical protein
MNALLIDTESTNINTPQPQTPIPSQQHHQPDPITYQNLNPQINQVSVAPTDLNTTQQQHHHADYQFLCRSLEAPHEMQFNFTPFQEHSALLTLQLNQTMVSLT